MANEIVFTSSWKLIVRNMLCTLLLLNVLFSSIALFSILSEEEITSSSILASLPVIERFLRFLLPLEASFLLLYVGGCYIQLSCTAQAISIYKPFALFGRHQVQLLAGLEQVSIARFKSQGFVFKRVSTKDERVEFDFLSKASLAGFAAFLQQHAVATTNF